jgi:endonuclease YncB( thermonuclease family)
MLSRSLSTLAVFAVMASPAFADGKCFTHPGQEVAGPVDYSRHYDGDTFYIGRDRVRIWGIDAPEPNEFGYAEAAEHLRVLTQKGTLSCEVKYWERGGYRHCVAVCTKFSAAYDLGQAMINHGWAKVHPRYIGEDPKLKPKYEAAEREARDAKRGLWR